ncbi:hypothetical protein HSBAA_56720 [Vreelandella sulfidaeris]|uniref:PpiC domain-containing protein n=1 Tax=Vreelandella sulfidaeris TaxID=115553 RepID=A0A455UDN7_9GAMM|nr:hypothetical protein HSBAA_56720 [Halomonas sulfidaeris]
MTQASARHILVSSEEQCLALKEEIQNGRDFAEVAKEHSSCPPAAKVATSAALAPAKWCLSSIRLSSMTRSAKCTAR